MMTHPAVIRCRGPAARLRAQLGPSTRLRNRLILPARSADLPVGALCVASPTPPARIVAHASRRISAAGQRRSPARAARAASAIRRLQPPRPTATQLGIITVEIAMMPLQGLTDLTPLSYSPLALMNEIRRAYRSSPNSPYKTVKSCRAIKASRGRKIQVNRAPS